jgi:hypothetical protein
MRHSDVSAVCEYCHTPFTRRFWASTRPPPRFCSYRCRGLAARVPPDERVRQYEYVWTDDGRVPLHRMLFLNAHGPGPHPCHWCGTSVVATPGARTKQGALVVDHLDDDPSNNAIDNLVPSCHRCNCTRSGPPPKYVAEFTCEQCGATFERVGQHRRDRPIRFCSRRCRYLATGQ